MEPWNQHFVTGHTSQHHRRSQDWTGCDRMRGQDVVETCGDPTTIFDRQTCLRRTHSRLEQNRTWHDTWIWNDLKWHEMIWHLMTWNVLLYYIIQGLARRTWMKNLEPTSNGNSRHSSEDIGARRHTLAITTLAEGWKGRWQALAWKQPWNVSNT